MMWKQFNPDGTLKYGNFLETVTAIMPMYAMRDIGGSLYVLGIIILVYNVYKTMSAVPKIEDELAEAPTLARISPTLIKGECFHAWLDRKLILLTGFASIVILIVYVVQIVFNFVYIYIFKSISNFKFHVPVLLVRLYFYIR